MHVAGLLGGTFGSRLAAASAILVVRLALVVVRGMIPRLIIASEFVVMIALPAATSSFVG